MTAGLHTFLLRMKTLFRKRRMDRDMAEELEFHQMMLRKKLLREGVPQAEVDATARRTFGNARRWHERLRELWQFRALENFLRDMSFSARLLKKSPGFTAVALLTLAIGIGANTAIFSLINGLLLRPLPVPHADRLVVLNIHRGGPEPRYSFSSPVFRGLERNRTIFADVFAFFGEPMQIHGGSGNEEIQGVLVSGQYFRALQTPPLMGRYLTPADDQTGGNAEGFGVVISEHFWQRWFHGAPDVVGRKLVIANTPFTVVGVMPKRFTGVDPTQRPEIYAPLSTEPILDAPYDMTAGGLHASWLTVMGRLQAGVTLQQANAALLPISMSIVREQASDANWEASAMKVHMRFAAEPGAKGYTYVRILFHKPLAAMFAMCGGILLLACLNLASLLMARSAARERELATRLALGATRRRLIQQLLVESLLIATVGTAAGLAVSPLVSQLLAAMLLRGAWDGYVDTSIDVRVFLFAAGIAVIATFLIGLAPALQATAGDLNEHIKQGKHAHSQHTRQRMAPRMLMAVEVALALVLVAGAGLLATSLVRLYRTGLGFNTKGLVNISFDMDKQPLEGDALTQLYQALGDGLRHLPGVKSVSWENTTPLAGMIIAGSYHTPSSNGGRKIFINTVASEYFATMRIPMFEGREFRWDDSMAGGKKIILNQAAAKILFPGQNAVGQHVLTSKDSYEVIAVVGNVKYTSIQEAAPAGAYFPITQSEWKKASYTAVVRVDGPVAPLAAASRALATRLAPTIPAPVMTTMDSVINDSISAERMMALLSVFFAGCALLITAIGLYGTLAYATARRTSEIGIRMALGAQRGQVVRMVFGENARVAMAGCVAGLAAAVLASRVLASFLYEISPHDPWVLLGSVAVLLAIASGASLLPALRAARINPIIAIRCE
ncbi:MAG TPA: ABC transporter permease [Acidobacteriaceae bacterium]|jgi:predicted permease|nr:ABC transporter permease [Acidobacteriaceae bacterium]